MGAKPAGADAANPNANVTSNLASRPGAQATGPGSLEPRRRADDDALIRGGNPAGVDRKLKRENFGMEPVR